MLSPIIGLNKTNTSIVLTDSTVYGLPNELRSQVKINFQVDRLLSDGTIIPITLPYYNPDSVNNIEVGIPKDGRYKVIMTLTLPNGDDLVVMQETFFLEYTEQCRLNFLKEFICSCCGIIKNASSKTKFNKVDITMRAINILIENENYQDAQCALEGITTLCEGHKPCKC